MAALLAHAAAASMTDMLQQRWVGRGVLVEVRKGGREERRHWCEGCTGGQLMARADLVQLRDREVGSKRRVAGCMWNL